MGIRLKAFHMIIFGKNDGMEKFYTKYLLKYRHAQKSDIGNGPWLQEGAERKVP